MVSKVRAKEGTVNAFSPSLLTETETPAWVWSAAKILSLNSIYLCQSNHNLGWHYTVWIDDAGRPVRRTVNQQKRQREKSFPRWKESSENVCNCHNRLYGRMDYYIWGCVRRREERMWLIYLKHIYASAYYLYQMCCVWMPQCVCACVLVCPMSLLNESALNSAVYMELSWKCPLELKVVGYLRSRQRDISLCCVVK